MTNFRYCIIINLALLLLIACKKEGDNPVTITTEIFKGWVIQSSGTTVSLNSVFFTDINTGVVVGDSGIILRTTNAGVTWETVNSGMVATLNRVSFVNKSIGTIVGTQGTIIRTTDVGKRWTQQISGTNETLHGVSFTDANNGAVVGENGTLLLTTDGGTNWLSQTPIKWDTMNLPVSKYFYDVSYPALNHIIAITGYNLGFCLCTTNGGATWIYNRNVNGSSPRIVFLNKDVGTLYCPDHTTGQNFIYILRTTDGGVTWNYSSTIGGTYSNDVSFSDLNNGTIVGYPSSVGGSTIQHTTDGGQTWTPQSSGTTASLFGVFFVDANNGTIVGGNGTILRTSTGGQ